MGLVLGSSAFPFRRERPTEATRLLLLLSLGQIVM